MKKSDLRDGMVIDDKTGEKGFILNGYINKKNGCVSLANYNEDLTHKFREKLDIKKVYKVDGPCKLDELLNKVILIWERPKEIDWSKVPKWTKIQIKYGGNGRWRNRYFIRFNPYKKTPYIVSVLDKFIFDDELGQDFSKTNSYKYCRIHPLVVIPEEWYR